MSDLTALYQTLSQRPRPEDVADLLLTLLRKHLTQPQRELLKKTAAGSVRKDPRHYSAMPTEFARPVGAARQARTAAGLFDYPLPAADPPAYRQPGEVAALLGELSPRLGKTVGRTDYRLDRLNRDGRATAGVAGLGELSRRRYNKLFRALRHLEAKQQRLTQAGRLREFQLVSKHGLAHEITAEDFGRDLFSAAFVAYYTARCNRRSERGSKGQPPPYDRVADMLYRRCRNARPETLPGGPDAAAPAEAATGAMATNWAMLARVYPDPEVLEYLTDAELAELLGRWMTLLTELAGQLRRAWAANKFGRDAMEVQPGDDSSTWNLTAGAWNKARDNWLNLLYALGLEGLLDEVCPGKAMRLMSADVVHLHRLSGRRLDPNLRVWAALPLPWDVLDGTAPCGWAQVAAACQAAGLDPEKTGWLAPRPRRIAKRRPTPELVNGVSVGNPYLAQKLRQDKTFSGNRAHD